MPKKATQSRIAKAAVLASNISVYSPAKDSDDLERCYQLNQSDSKVVVEDNIDTHRYLQSDQQIEFSTAGFIPKMSV